jgi:hypothetical protein
MFENCYEMINNSTKFPKAMLLAPNKHTAISLMVIGILMTWDGFSLEHCFSVGYNI